MLDSNPFEHVGEGRATRRMQKKLQKASQAPLVPTALEKKLRDKKIQLGIFLRWKREIRQGLIDGTYGVEIIMLLKLLRKVPEPQVLVDWVRDSRWLLKSNQKVKNSVLDYLAETMARWNVRHGIAPFNDSLPEQPDSEFIVIRKLLTGV